MTTIVTGFVDSPEGHGALDLAVAETRVRGGRLIVVHSMKGGAKTSAEDVLRYRDALAAVEQRLASEGIDHEVHEYVRGATPAEDLLAAASEFDADLLVIGYRRRTSAGKFVLGSHAHEILMGAECPVLAIVAP